MQTFLPYSSFEESAKVLDWRRLGKQRVEAMQIYNAITSDSIKGWKNHPGTKMWTGYTDALIKYGFIVSKEWLNRGYNGKICMDFFKSKIKNREVVMPSWLGTESLHLAYRSTLLRKDFEWYKQFKWDCSDDLNIIYPKPLQKTITEWESHNES